MHDDVVVLVSAGDPLSLINDDLIILHVCAADVVLSVRVSCWCAGNEQPAAVCTSPAWLTDSLAVCAAWLQGPLGWRTQATVCLCFMDLSTELCQFHALARLVGVTQAWFRLNRVVFVADALADYFIVFVLSLVVDFLLSPDFLLTHWDSWQYVSGFRCCQS